MGWLVDIINWLLEQIGNAGTELVSRLPESPLKWTAEIDSQILSWINWLIPIGEMIVAFEGVLICVAVYYLISIILRWLKVSGG